MIIKPGELKFGMRAGAYPVITTADDFVKYTKTQTEPFVVEFAGTMIPLADIATGARIFDVNPSDKRFRSKNNIETKIRRVKDYREWDTHTFIVSVKSVPKDSGIAYIEGEEETKNTTTVSPKKGESKKTKKATEIELKEGSKATLIAIPAPNYYFTNWTGDLKGEIEPISIVVDSDKKIIAHFKKEKGK